MAKENNVGMYVGIGVLVLIVLSVLFIWGSYNGLVTSEIAVDEASANVDTSYQRRYDLIPNLVETVKGYASHEKDLFTEITALRSQWASASTVGEKQAASTALEGSLGRLLLVAENYPQLKANENFLSLQDELAGTENRIAVARTRYNEAVRTYNTALRTFPRNMVGSMFGFTSREFYEAESGAEKAPKVSF